MEEQQNEFDAIKRKQALHSIQNNSNSNNNNNSMGHGGGNGGPRTSNSTNSTALIISGENKNSGNSGGNGPSLQEKRQAAQLMESTETLMKFGFMSMSMTYFSSLNMIKALRTVSAQDTVMAALADVQAQRAAGNGQGGGIIKIITLLVDVIVINIVDIVIVVLVITTIAIISFIIVFAHT